MKKLKDENDFLKDEMNQPLIARNISLKIKLICDISCSKNDIDLSLDKDDFPEAFCDEIM